MVPGEPTLEQSVLEGSHPVEGTHAGAVNEGLYCLEKTPCWSRLKL